MLLNVIFCISTALSESELQIENAELRISNEILHKQLMELSSLNSLITTIQEDFSYNKAKLSALLEEYSQDSPSNIRIALAEQIQYYLAILYEDLILIGNDIESISASDIEVCLKFLSESIERSKSKHQTQEFNKSYYELKSLVNRKDESLKTLQLENSKLIGRLDDALAELDQAAQSYAHSSKRLESLISGLSSTKSEQQARLESLKISLQTEEQNSRSKEIEDFKRIQTSQDELILKLENKSAEQSIRLEKLMIEKVNINAKIRVLSSTIERLNNEIEARNKQLELSEEKFEEFRRQIESESNEEIVSLRNSEEMLKSEVNLLQERQIGLLVSITACSKELDALEMEKRQKENQVRELELDIVDARKGIQSAKDGRGHEFSVLQKKLEDSEKALEVLQGQLETSLIKISKQNLEIRELNERLEELRFLTDNRIDAKGLRGLTPSAFSI